MSLPCYLPDERFRVLLHGGEILLAEPRSQHHLKGLCVGDEVRRAVGVGVDDEFRPCGSGEFRDMAEASYAIVKTGFIYEPLSEKKALYDELFGLYRESYQALKGIFPRLSGESV